MATVIRCDRPECINDAPAGNTPRGWVAQDRALYCSPRCATLALGGVWPDDPVPAAYAAALAGTPVDASTITERSVRVEVLEAVLRGETDRKTQQAAASGTDDGTDDGSSAGDDGDAPAGDGDDGSPAADPPADDGGDSGTDSGGDDAPAGDGTDAGGGSA